MTIDILELLDYSKPEASEQRLRQALASASGEDVLILTTQIARTYGIRRDFEQARRILASMQAQIPSASAEAQVHYYLELGRTYASATHPPDQLTEENREEARPAYLRAFELAREVGLDYLAIDALHMMTMVDPSPGDQLEWNRKATAFMQASSQPETKKWEASLHNNTGYALHLLGRYEEALQEFQLSLAAHQRRQDANRIRIAHWMIAWTLHSLGRLEEAIAIQLRLEEEWDQAGQPDPYVFEELEQLYRAEGNQERADFYAARLKNSDGG